MTDEKRKQSAEELPVINAILKHSTLYLSSVFSLTVLIIYFYLNALSNSQLEELAIKKAEGYVHVLATFRSLYTSEVVIKARSENLLVTHNYKDFSNAIPLPATLSMLIGNKLGGKTSDIRSKLYSGYPFPWREESAGLTDQFSKDAWQAFQQFPQLPFYRFEKYNGKMSLRYARADVMRESCIECHNTHPDTPKADWKLGDVRGVLEVITPVDKDITSSNSVIQHTLLLLILILFLALLGIRSIMQKLNERRIEAKEFMAEAIKANTQLEREVSFRKLAQEKLLAMSLTDGLTGISNRRKFDQELELQWRRARREESSLSIIMLDVDNFKYYNDNYGHQSGDDVLCQLANTISEQVHRATDLFCRYGGEEFVILLGNTNAFEAKTMAERVRKSVESVAIAHKFSNTSKVITISLGIATFIPDDHHNAAQLLKGADVALYEAKEAGRNCSRNYKLE